MVKRAEHVEFSFGYFGYVAVVGMGWAEGGVTTVILFFEFLHGNDEGWVGGG